MRIDIWSDVVCPFCYIGKRRLEKALKNYDSQENVEIIWHSFQLDPNAEAKPGVSPLQYLAEAKGISLAESEAMHKNVVDMAKSEGLDFRFDQAVVANTWKAHKLLQLAKLNKKGDAMKERLMNAYFSRGEDLNNEDVLIRIGEELELAESELGDLFESPLYDHQVKKDIEQSREIGVSAVPFFVFEGKYALRGAQPEQVFAEVLEKL